MAVLTAATVGVVPATQALAAPRVLAAAGTPFPNASFAAYGTGSELHVDAVTSGSTTLAGVEEAFSANTASGGFLGGEVTSPDTGAVVQSDLTGDNANAYGRGSGLEVGLGLTTAQENQIKLGLAEAHAAPPSGLITKTALPLSVPPLLNVGLLTGKAEANYNASFCPVGQPLAYGQGQAAAPTAVAGENPPTALVSGTGAAGTQAAQTTTRTDLTANTDGTFGLENTVEEIIAPVTVNLGTLSIQVTVQGNGPSSPLTVTTFNNGEGSTGVRYANNNPLVKVAILSGSTTLLSLTPVTLSGLAALINPLLGTGGTIYDILHPLGINLSVDVGVASALPNAMAGATSVSYNLLAINASLPGSGLTIANADVGHVESEVLLPSGPIACTIPVSKTANPTTVTAGNTFTWSISIPSSASALSDSACDLTNIAATDKIAVDSGSPTFTINSISNGGAYNASTSTVTWTGLGTYHPGDPPIVLTIAVSVPAGSAAGVLEDTANVTASLGNCTGGVTGSSTINNAVIGGSITLVAPSVSAVGAGLATTGQGPELAWIAAGLLVMAEVSRRLLRRARKST
jgi:hypothetical protein